MTENSRFKSARSPDVHLHECKHREDAICIAHRYCECECGAKRAFPSPFNQTRADWATSSEAFE